MGRQNRAEATPSAGNGPLPRLKGSPQCWREVCSTKGMSLFPPTVPDLRFLSVPTRRGTTRRRPDQVRVTSEQARVARIFRQHASEMKPYLCRRGVAGEDADDVLQRVFI